MMKNQQNKNGEKEIINFSAKILNEPNSYIDSYVAYLDILGFKELVRKKSAKEIKKIYDEIRWVSTLYRNASIFNLSKEIKQNLEISFLSDSIIINIPKDIPFAFYGLVVFCLNVQFKLIGLGRPVLIRGAINQGDFFRYYDKDTGAVIIFGNSVIDAFNLEENLAIVPRIILNETLFKSELNRLSGDNFSILNTFTRKAEDGYMFLDYMKMRMDLGNDITTKCIQIKEYIQSELTKQTDERILSKLEWMKKYFNSTIKESYNFLNNNTVDEMIIV